MPSSADGFQTLKKLLKKVTGSTSPEIPDGLRRNEVNSLETAIFDAGGSYATITGLSASVTPSGLENNSSATCWPQMGTAAQQMTQADQQMLQQLIQQPMTNQYQHTHVNTGTWYVLGTPPQYEPAFLIINEDTVKTLARCKPHLEYCDVYCSGNEIIARHLSTAKEHRGKIKEWALLAIEQTLREIQDQIIEDSIDDDELTDDFIWHNRVKTTSAA